MHETEYRERKIQALEMQAAAIAQLTQLATEFFTLLKKEIEEERKLTNTAYRR